VSFGLALSGAALLILVVTGLDFVLGSRRIAMLAELPPADGDDLPFISVVVAARNEERNIEAALHSMLDLDYPRLEIIVVDDRSEDRTGEIVRRLAGAPRQAAPALRTIRIDTLPAGWLGKNHALQRGAAVATGELLLFSDADIIMKRGTLRRAVRYMVDNGVDHLALGPEVIMPGALPAAFGLTGTLFFSFATRPWKARDPRSRAYVGIGAFNLLRRDLYERMGGHRRIALRPDDDMKLGKLVKLNGGKQDFVHGRGLVAVEWYASLGELARGLTKNTFAALNYSVAVVVAATLGQLLLFVWPPVALAVLRGVPQLLALAAVVLVLLMHGEALRVQRGAPLLALLYPVVSLLMIFIMWRSTLLTLARGGIEWRGTRYPLAELRANRL
jgi:cellulose synthase/poly-beta-1,6-N-acetylglucosamine synthase-like glycosyltransferase